MPISPAHNSRAVPDVRSYGSAGKRSVEQSEAARKDALALIAAVPDGAVIIFTDGSSLGNPGPCGAGAQIQIGDSLVEMVAALGEGTNIIGEAWAIGMAMQYTALHPPRDIYIFSDCQIVIDILNVSAGIRSNLSLMHAVRALVTTLRRTRKVFIHWVGGHTGLDGNEAADRLADLGSRRSADNGMPCHRSFIGSEYVNSGAVANSHIDIRNIYTSITISQVNT